MRGWDVSKRNLKEFTIASNEFATQNWLDWGDVHWDEQNSTGKSLLLSIAWRVRKTKEKLLYHTEQIRQKCTDETPIRLPRSTYKYAPSSPWIWRRKVAFVVFFIQYLMVAVEWMNTGGAHKFKIVNDFWAHAMSSPKEQGDLFWMFTHQETQNEILTRFCFQNLL